MKFRAMLRDARTLLQLCNAVKGFSKRVTLKLHGETIRVIAATTEVTDGAQLWASVSADAIFGELVIESKSDNTIFCELPDIGLLCFALRHADRGDVSMRLAKAGSRQMLAIHINSAIAGQDTQHEVPLRVLTEIEVTRIVAPALDLELSEIIFPTLSHVAPFIDSAKAATCTSCAFTLTPDDATGAAHQQQQGQHPDDLMNDAPPIVMTGGGGPSCSLTLTSEGPTMTFEAHFQSVAMPPTATPPERPVSVTVDLRRLSRFFAVREVNPSKIVAHMAHKHALILTVHSGPSNIIVYLPALAR